MCVLLVHGLSLRHRIGATSSAMPLSVPIQTFGLRGAIDADPGHRQFPCYRQNDRPDEKADDAVRERSPDHPDEDHERWRGQATGP